MATENLKRLSLKLLATPLAEDGSVYFAVKDYQASTALLPDGLRDDVNALIGDVLAVVPNDFAFWFFFGVEGAAISVEFEDGNTGSTAFDGRFTSRKSMLQKLRAVDWEKKRGELIESGGIFEKLVSEADDRPAAIPSSRDAAERFSQELDTICAELKEASDADPFSMVIVREDSDIEVAGYPTRAAVVFEMAEVMTVGYEILAVIENGVRWDFDAIETAKLEAVQQLGPISRAKAERRFNLS